jgi:transcriptional regulator with XRE-family HTH domain
MSQNSEIFSITLRKAREGKRLSQTDLAKKAGFEPSAISHFETGRRAPSFDNLKRLADALSVSIDYLTGRVEKPSGCGPMVDQLFRDFSKMTEDDQQAISKMANILAEKNKK